MQENKINTSLLVEKYNSLLELELDSEHIEYYELLQIFIDTLQKIEKEEKDKKILILRENYKNKFFFSFRAFHIFYEKKVTNPTNLFFFLQSEPNGSFFALNELFKTRISTTKNYEKQTEEILNLEKMFPENELEQKYSDYMTFCESTYRIDFPKLPIENHDTSLNMRMSRQSSLNKNKKKKKKTVNFENRNFIEIKKSITLKDSQLKRKNSLLENKG